MFDRNLLRIDSMTTVLILSTVVEFLLAILTLGQALFLAFALANLWSGEPFDTQIPLVVGFVACFFLRQIIGVLRDTAIDRYSLRIADGLRAELLKQNFEATPSLSRRVGSGVATEMLIQDCDAISLYVRTMPIKATALVAVGIPILIAMFYLDWVSGIILVITTPVIIYFMRLLGLHARERAADQYGIYQQLAHNFLDTLRGLPTLISFKAAEREDKRVWMASEKLRKSSIKTIGIATLSSALLDLTATLGVAAIAMMLAFRLLDGSMGLGIALTCLMLAPEYYTPLRSFAADFHASLNAKQALSKVFEVCDSKPSVRHPRLSEESLYDDSPLLWTNDSVLEAQNLTYCYTNQNNNEAQEQSDNESHTNSSPGTEALKSISFKLSAGEHLAVIGPSGSGKSTLINLLAGFIKPSSGTFDLSGTTASSLACKSWEEQVHYIPQNPYIFSTTIKENVAFYFPEATDEQVIKALEKVGLGSFLNELPDGIYTKIGSGNRGVSGGQAQRIALARVMLDPRPVLLFDEPTAHLDIQTEHDLVSDMLELMQGRTVVFATHRLHWLNVMDRALVLDAGRITSQEVT